MTVTWQRTLFTSGVSMMICRALASTSGLVVMPSRYTLPCSLVTVNSAAWVTGSPSRRARTVRDRLPSPSVLLSCQPEPLSPPSKASTQPERFSIMAQSAIAVKRRLMSFVPSVPGFSDLGAVAAQPHGPRDEARRQHQAHPQFGARQEAADTLDGHEVEVRGEQLL